MLYRCLRCGKRYSSASTKEQRAECKAEKCSEPCDGTPVNGKCECFEEGPSICHPKVCGIDFEPFKDGTCANCTLPLPEGLRLNGYAGICERTSKSTRAPGGCGTCPPCENQRILGCHKGTCTCPDKCECVGFGCDHAGSKQGFGHPQVRRPNFAKPAPADDIPLPGESPET